MTSETKISPRVASSRSQELARDGDEQERQWARWRFRDRNVRRARRGTRLGFYDPETYEDLLSEDWDD